VSRFLLYTRSSTDAKEDFVQVSKHHDGIAIVSFLLYILIRNKTHLPKFDTKNTSDRNTVKLGPKRDLLSEIMSAASAKYPTMRRGTYFSLPEWYHPDYAQFGFGDTRGSVHGSEADGTPIIGSAAWPGGLAHNAYNESAPLEPYTGYVKSPTNYLVDIQGPQMKMLMDNYGTEILWFVLLLHRSPIEYGRILTR
jgi:alpha-L-fucosidase